MAYNILKATPDELKTLDEAITDFNIKIALELPRAEIHRLDFSAKNERSQLLGGIQAYWVNWGILHVELIYVFEPFRQQGIASNLLQHIEGIAKQNGCHLAHLDTFDFQAKDFYLEQGYSIFGILDDCPSGHKRYYMKKNLNSPEGKQTIQSAHEEIFTENEPSKCGQMNPTIHLLNASESEKACRELTHSLPEYFGIQEANERYAKGVRRLLTFGAKLNDIYVGLISLEMPFPNNANIYWMAVRKEYHGQGVGCSLLKYAESYCSKRQCTSMTVETLSPVEKDLNYIKTYAFYQKNGFEPLFELNTYGPDFKMVYLYKKLGKSGVFLSS